MLLLTLLSMSEIENLIERLEEERDLRINNELKYYNSNTDKEDEYLSIFAN